MQRIISFENRVILLQPMPYRQLPIRILFTGFEQEIGSCTKGFQFNSKS